MITASDFHRTWLIAAAILSVLCLAGCQPEPQIRQYTVPKLATASQQQAMPSADQPRTMLGAIVLAGGDAWFFKATAAPDVIAEHREAITKFLRGTTFSATGESPRWELPEGWKQEPGDNIRFATIRIGTSESPLELTVTKLPRGDDDAAAILQNVNRWRGQLQLPATTSVELDKEAERFAIGEFPCTLVELVGTGSRSMGGPFSGGPFSGGGLPKDHPPIDAATAGAAPQPGAGTPKLTFTTPDGWQEMPAGGFRQASFAVMDGAFKADISVTLLSLQGGDVVANVNRWRQQVGLPPQSAEEVAQSVREVAGQEIQWQVVELVGTAPAGDPQTILGAIGKTPQAAWFVKLTAPPPLAQREKEHFDQFVGSLKVN